MARQSCPQRAGTESSRSHLLHIRQALAVLGCLSFLFRNGGWSMSALLNKSSISFNMLCVREEIEGAGSPQGLIGYT